MHHNGNAGENGRRRKVAAAAPRRPAADVTPLFGHDAIAAALADLRVLHACLHVRLAVVAHVARVRQPRKLICVRFIRIK